MSSEKPELGETCKLYEAVPVDEFQLKVGLAAMPVTSLDGEASDGADGAATIVVKFQEIDQSLVPPSLAALTRQ